MLLNCEILLLLSREQENVTKEFLESFELYPYRKENDNQKMNFYDSDETEIKLTFY